MEKNFVWVCWYSKSQIEVTSSPTKALDLIRNFVVNFYDRKKVTCEIEKICFEKWKQESLEELSKSFLENSNCFGVEGLCRVCRETLV